MMRRIVFALALLVAMPLFAASIEVGGQHLVALPTGETGTLDVALSRGFAASAEVFWSDAFSTRASAAFVNPEAILRPDSPPPDDVDLGTLGMDVYSVTARLHWPRNTRWSGFAGAGGAYVILGNLDDQFGDAIEVEFDPRLTVAGEVGVRFRFREHIYLETAATWMPLDAKGDVRRSTDPRTPVPDEVTLDPLIVSVGATWRF